MFFWAANRIMVGGYSIKSRLFPHRQAPSVVSQEILDAIGPYQPYALAQKLKPFAPPRHYTPTGPRITRTACI